MKKVIIIGAGGNGKVIASNIDDIKKKKSGRKMTELSLKCATL